MSAISVRLARPGPLGASAPSAALWLAGAVVLGAAIGIAVAAGQTTVALAIMTLPGLAVLLLRPDWLPPILIATVFGEALLSGSVTLSRLAAPLAALIMLLALPGRTRFRFPRPAVLVAAIAYSLWALASVLWTINPDSSFRSGGTGYALASLALSFIYMLAVAMFVQTEEHVRRLIVVAWLASVLAGAVSIGQYLTGYSRAVGLSGDANFFAAVQVIVLPLEALLASQVRSRRARIIVLAGMAVTVGSIITSLSRGGILGLAAVFLLLCLQPAQTFFRTRARKRTFVVAVLVGAIVLLIASFTALEARTSSLFTTADNGSGRTNLWMAAVTGYERHPITGMGFGSFIGQSDQLILETPGENLSAYQLRPTGQVVHNAYLESLTELGPVGLALFLGLLVAMAVTLRRTARDAARAGATFLSSTSRALLLSVAGFALTSVFLSTETQRTLWVLLGLSLAMPRVLLAWQRENRGASAVSPSATVVAPSAGAARSPGRTRS